MTESQISQPSPMPAPTALGVTSIMLAPMRPVPMAKPPLPMVQPPLSNTSPISVPDRDTPMPSPVARLSGLDENPTPPRGLEEKPTPARSMLPPLGW